MRKDVILHLDDFGHSAVARFMGPGDAGERLVRCAWLYYLADRDSSRPSWRSPRFVRSPTGRALTVPIDPETWSALDEEAGRQGVSRDSLALHAIAYFLADLDSGRLADRLAELLDDG
jgi:hypothetical protein